MTVWVCGEVLVDLLPDKAVIGGGPANTAKALARLGREVEFIGGISSDEYGQLARSEFGAAGVGLGFAHKSEKRTATARVSIDIAGSASYLFDLKDTATFDFSAQWLPDPARFKPSLLHIGTLATIIEPGASALYEWAMNVAQFAPIVFDPNVRPSVQSDRALYIIAVEKWVALSTVVKVSEDDLDWLYPDAEILDVARRWLDTGIEIVVITKGERGLVALTHDEIHEVPARSVTVVDTVGAGDTVGAVILDSIIEHGIPNLRGRVLDEVLDCAARAAAITCSRAGAKPPSKSELAADEKRP